MYYIFSVHIFKPYFRLTKILSANLYTNFKAHGSICFIIENNKKVNTKLKMMIITKESNKTVQYLCN